MLFFNLVAGILGCSPSQGKQISGVDRPKGKDSDSGVDATTKADEAIDLPDPEKLTDEDKAILSRLGINDGDNSGTISEDEISGRVFDQSSFKRFARISGYTDQIDGEDFIRVRRDPEALAQLIREDPEYQETVVGQGELISSSKDPRVNIPRLCAYAQMAYAWHIYPGTFPESGVVGTHGPKTTETTAQLQNYLNITTPAKDHAVGEAIGKNVMGGILLMLDHPPEELKTELGDLSIEGTLYFTGMRQSSQELLIAGLRYLHPTEIPMNGHPSRAQGAATDAINKHYGTRVVTQDVLNGIKRDLEQKFPSR
jgi:hypothetical protein